MHSHFPVQHSAGRVLWAYSAKPCAEACPARPLFRWRVETQQASGLRRAFEGATPGPLPATPEAAFAASKAGDRRLASFSAHC